MGDEAPAGLDSAAASAHGERFLVTGVLGCLGAWVARAVLADGGEVVGFDLGDNTARLRLVLGEDADRITLVRGDITDLDALEWSLDEHGINRLVHLAALQVPFVRADPPLGMQVNVAGTVNVFEAVSRRLERIPCVAYASSAAVYAPSDPSPAPEPGGTAPQTLYGVSKLADEGIARVYAADAGLPSIGLRPYVVYGPGRDQGMTSGPTEAMLAAVHGEPYTIGFSGAAQYDYAPDVARAFVMAAAASRSDAAVYNVPGVVASVEDVVAAIHAVVPEAEITWSGDPLPFPSELEALGFDRDVGRFPRTTLEDGVAATITHFRAAA
ncbi:MAG TPA: NAD(P)-dependent oxidoreductase [Gaiella sp.]|nr:NAD(P)-dependent oxidoreductase [Gaiella sp.]